MHRHAWLQAAVYQNRTDLLGAFRVTGSRCYGKALQDLTFCLKHKQYGLQGSINKAPVIPVLKKVKHQL